MSGHSKWSQIKHQKGAADKKRGALFSKLLKAVSVAAKAEANPQFNPRLRSVIEKAKEHNVSQENIERAITRAAHGAESYDELLFEAYAPGGVALLIEAITDNRNRTVAEVKKLLSDHGGKWAETGSVQWAFEKTSDGWSAKFPQEVDPGTRTKLNELVGALRVHDDVEEVWVAVSSS